MISWFPNNKNPERWALTQHRYSTTVILGDKYNKICETDNLNKDREKKKYTTSTPIINVTGQTKYICPICVALTDMKSSTQRWKIRS